jgi:hypothetical protein
MANMAEDHLINLYRSLKKLRKIITKMELKNEHFPVVKEDSQEIHKVDVLLPIVERYIITTLNRSIRDD